MARALVTGGAGYFGSLLCERLCQRGDQVRVFDIAEADASQWTASVEIVRGDVRDENAVRQACDGIEVVFHNVAQVPLARDAALFHSVNYTGTANVLAAARDAGVRKVVHTSSSAVFGVPDASPIDEQATPRPREDYGRAKLAAEHLVAECVAAHGQDVTVIRPRTVLGHGRLGIFQILFEWVGEGRRIPVLGGGGNLYQFVHADDLADACVRAAERPGPALYNIGTDRFGTMRETLTALCRHAGTGARVYSLPLTLSAAAMRLSGALGVTPFAPYHALMYGRTFYFDISRALRELQWQPRWSNEEMICQSYDWYQANKTSLGAEKNSPHRSAVRQGLLAALRRLS